MILRLLMLVLYIVLILASYKLTYSFVGIYVKPPRKNVIGVCIATIIFPLLIALAAFTHDEVLVGVLCVVLTLINAISFGMNISDRFLEFFNKVFNK